MTDSESYTLLTLENVLSFSEKQIKRINDLLTQLGPDVPPISQRYLERVVQTSQVFVALDINGIIVGLACLAPIIAITSPIGYLTHIVVDDSLRRQGIASDLLRCLIADARQLGLKRIDLTSQASRTAAQLFWEKQGFVKRETNNFRLELK